MKHSTLIALVFAVLLLPFCGAGQGSDSVFEEYDLDGDDVIDRIEFGMSAVAQKAREEGREDVIGERFDKLDVDRDNAVNRYEFENAVALRALEEQFVSADANRDDKLSPLEFFQASGSTGKLEESKLNFNRADSDKDGYVDRKEWASVRASEGALNDQPGDLDLKQIVRDKFADADRDEDGQISEKEFGRTDYGEHVKNRGGRDMVEIFFARLDTDQNAHLSLQEFSLIRSQLRPIARKGKMKGGKKGGR